MIKWEPEPVPKKISSPLYFQPLFVLSLNFRLSVVNEHTEKPNSMVFFSVCFQTQLCHFIIRLLESYQNSTAEHLRQVHHHFIKSLVSRWGSCCHCCLLCSSFGSKFSRSIKLLSSSCHSEIAHITMTLVHYAPGKNRWKVLSGELNSTLHCWRRHRLFRTY